MIVGGAEFTVGGAPKQGRSYFLAVSNDLSENKNYKKYNYILLPQNKWFDLDPLSLSEWT